TLGAGREREVGMIVTTRRWGQRRTTCQRTRGRTTRSAGSALVELGQLVEIAIRLVNHLGRTDEMRADGAEHRFTPKSAYRFASRSTTDRLRPQRLDTRRADHR